MDTRALLFLIVLFVSWCCIDARVVTTTLPPEWEINDEVVQHDKKLYEMMKDEGLCTLCEVVLVPIIHSLSNSTTQSETLAILHLFCTLTFITKDECNAIVDHYVPLIFNETSRLTPRMICNKVGLCIHETTSSSDLSQNNSESYNIMNHHQAHVTEGPTLNPPYSNDQMQIKLLEVCKYFLEDNSVNHACTSYGESDPSQIQT